MLRFINIFLVISAITFLAQYGIASPAGDNSFQKEAEKIVNSVEAAKLGIDHLDLDKNSSGKYLEEAKSIVEGYKAKESLYLDSHQIYEEEKNQEKIDVNALINNYTRMKKGGANQEQLPELMIFISLSIPQQSLEQIIRQVNAANGVLVLRGLYKGSIKETAKLLLSLNKDGIPAVIHPKLFKEYEVKSVPTYVLKNEIDCTDKCTPIFDKIVGNIPLDYALEQFVNYGDNKKTAKKYLSNLRRLQ